MTTVLAETNIIKSLFSEKKTSREVTHFHKKREVTHEVNYNLGHIPRNNSKASLWQAELCILSW
jgi:hypothetical protein